MRINPFKANWLGAQPITAKAGLRTLPPASNSAGELPVELFSSQRRQRFGE